MATRYNYNSNGNMPTFPASRSNAITKEYYQHLVGEINNKTLKSAVCKVTNETFGTETYHLLTK